MTSIDDIVTPNLPGGDEAKRRLARAIQRDRRYLQITAPTQIQVRDQVADLTRQMALLLEALHSDVSSPVADPPQPGD